MNYFTSWIYPALVFRMSLACCYAIIKAGSSFTNILSIRGLLVPAVYSPFSRFTVEIRIQSSLLLRLRSRELYLMLWSKAFVTWFGVRVHRSFRAEDIPQQIVVEKCSYKETVYYCMSNSTLTLLCSPGKNKQILKWQRLPQINTSIKIISAEPLLTSTTSNPPEIPLHLVHHSPYRPTPSPRARSSIPRTETPLILPHPLDNRHENRGQPQRKRPPLGRCLCL